MNKLHFKIVSFITTSESKVWDLIWFSMLRSRNGNGELWDVELWKNKGNQSACPPSKSLQSNSPTDRCPEPAVTFVQSQETWQTNCFWPKNFASSLEYLPVPCALNLGNWNFTQKVQTYNTWKKIWEPIPFTMHCFSPVQYANCCGTDWRSPFSA